MWPYMSRREERGRTNGRSRKVTRGSPPAASCGLGHVPGFGPLVEPAIDPSAALARDVGQFHHGDPFGAPLATSNRILSRFLKSMHDCDYIKFLIFDI
jgi:hypothetical protein